MTRPAKTKTGLFFGSFNPIHIGHLIIAQYFLEHTDLKEVWFVISPHNPLKEKQTLLANHHRLYMVSLAVEDTPGFRSCDIEFSMPQPSYTIDTVAYLKEKYPAKPFVLIMGGDNLATIHKWKNYLQLLEQIECYVYPRPGSDLAGCSDLGRISVISAPLMEISSSLIRSSVKAGKNVSFMLPPKVDRYMQEMHFYQ